MSLCAARSKRRAGRDLIIVVRSELKSRSAATLKAMGSLLTAADQRRWIRCHDYQFLFVSQRAKAAEPINLRLVEGKIPLDFPSGTYYLTRSGLFSDDHGSTVYPLDGHGYLRAFTIDGSKGQVKFMARYIQTEAQSEECDPVIEKWRFTHRGSFSILKGGKMVRNTKVMKNVANTSVLRWVEGYFVCGKVVTLMKLNLGRWILSESSMLSRMIRKKIPATEDLRLMFEMLLQKY
ncbi:carotenoid cleavage dioxygenase 7, chloroplastic [Olea europaea subsp. europaea]|uniref:Carotenoid cleavage dioxygenase 7, chloroplastic n=1 Tax=Olea europaea subsp. europaea TaxID=158383 RepID=A0A8S0PN29_OLEEU|nr:carotenoid cleavage dioxygenase 7, chloroplastic [Olea europaea subsp. europaea]